MIRPTPQGLPAAFDLVEVAPDRCQVTFAAIDYRDNDLGPDREVGVTFFVRPASAPDGEVGASIHRLPVDDGFAARPAVPLGFPKTVDEIDYSYGATSTAVTLTVDGEFVLRLTLPRAGDDEMPQMPTVTCTLIDGVPHAVAFSQGGSGFRVGDATGSCLEFGDHPIAADLKALGLPATPAFATWTERMQATFDAPRPV